MAFERRKGPWIWIVALVWLWVGSTSGCSSPSLQEREWLEARTENFQILSQLAPDETKELSSELEIFKSVVERWIGAGPFETRVPSRIVVFADSWSYRAFGPKGSVGYFVPTLRSNWALIDAGPNSRGAKRVLFHEYAHYIMNNEAEIAHPLWYEEGLADLLSSVVLEGDRVQVGRPPKVRLDTLRFLRPKDLLPVQQLFDQSYAKLASRQAAVFYAEAWAMVHYLQFGHRQGFPDRRQQVLKYLRLLNQGLTWRKACERAFETEPSQLIEELTLYLKNGRLGSHSLPRAEFPNPPAPRLRVVSESEIGLRLGELALALSHWRRAQDLFESVLDTQPENHRAIFGLAAARSATGIVEGLPELYDRGLKLGAADALSQLDYGLQLYRQISRDEGHPNAMPSRDRDDLLARARQHYVRAIEIDPDLPEAHANLGYSYMLEGQEPTLAIPHLERAFELVHSDPLLNFRLGQAYVAAGMLVRARRMFGRVAAQVHSSSGNPALAEALVLLDEEIAARGAGPGSGGVPCTPALPDDATGNGQHRTGPCSIGD